MSTNTWKCIEVHQAIFTNQAKTYTPKSDIEWAGNKIFSQMFVLQCSFTSPTFYGSLPTKNSKIYTFLSSFTNSKLVIHSSLTKGSYTTKNTASEVNPSKPVFHALACNLSITCYVSLPIA